MKADRVGRSIIVKEIPTFVEAGRTFASPEQLGIEIRYVGHSDVYKAITLDNIILPLIVKALNCDLGKTVTMKELTP